jgi:hypothetical protein
MDGFCSGFVDGFDAGWVIEGKVAGRETDAKLRHLVALNAEQIKATLKRDYDQKFQTGLTELRKNSEQAGSNLASIHLKERGYSASFSESTLDGIAAYKKLFAARAPISAYLDAINGGLKNKALEEANRLTVSREIALESITLATKRIPPGMESTVADLASSLAQKAREDDTLQSHSGGVLPATSLHYFRWSKLSDNCSTFYKNGERYQIMTANNVAVGYHNADEGRYTVVNVVIANQSNEAVDILPDHVRLGSKSPLDFAGSGKLTAGTAQALAHITRGSYAPGQGYQAPEYYVSQINGSLNGSSSSSNFSGTATTIHKTGPSGLMQVMANHAARVADQTQNKKDSVLRANTLMPGDKIAGTLYFAKDKSPQAQNLIVTIGQDIFIFENHN